MKLKASVAALAIAIAVTFPALAQHETAMDNTYRSEAMGRELSSEERAMEAYRYMEQLQNGFLLVRLNSMSKNIDALRKQGNHERADELEAEQRKKNQEIVKAFRDAYTFSPVYFMWTDSSHYITQNRKPTEFPLLNNDLEIDPNLKAPEDSYLIGDLSRTSSENTATLGSNGTPRTNMEVPAFVIRNRQLVQIAEPFPYFVRTFEQMPGEQSPLQIVEQLDRQLHDFHRPESR